MLCAKNTVHSLLKSVAVAGIIGNVFMCFSYLFACLYVSVIVPPVRIKTIIILVFTSVFRIFCLILK